MSFKVPTLFERIPKRAKLIAGPDHNHHIIGNILLEFLAFLPGIYHLFFLDQKTELFWHEAEKYRALTRRTNGSTATNITQKGFAAIVHDDNGSAAATAHDDNGSATVTVHDNGSVAPTAYDDNGSVAATV